MLSKLVIASSLVALGTAMSTGQGSQPEGGKTAGGGGNDPCSVESSACAKDTDCAKILIKIGNHDEEPSQEFYSACNANKLCQALMQCQMDHGEGDGDGSGDNGDGFVCEGEITCDLNTCMEKLTVAQGTDTSKCRSEIHPHPCPRQMAGVKGSKCDPWFEPPARAMNATEIAAEQNTVCGAFSANPVVDAKCREDVKCMVNPDAANCQQGPHVDNDHGDKDHKRREQFEACIQDATTGGMKNETGINACKDDIMEMAKMEATMMGKGAMFDQTFEFDFDEIEHMATVHANPCGAFEGDATAKATCEKCSETGKKNKTRVFGLLLLPI
jgi:hypothetical protein